MMKITIAENAGFCFGVQRAVDLMEQALSEHEKVYCIGALIHNKNFVSGLEARGMVTITPEQIDSLPEDAVVFVRAHGVCRDLYDSLRNGKRRFVDATCPFVSHIHTIVSEHSADGSPCIILGDAKHPEVQGIISFACGPCVAAATAEEALRAVESFGSDARRCFAVSQTTFDTQEWKFFLNNFKKLYTNAKKFDTICKVTEMRQKEAAELSAGADAVVVVGGPTSSNTAKLFAIAARNCPNTFHIESAADVPPLAPNLSGAHHAVIIAGASTPSEIIQEVYKTMADTMDTMNEEFDYAKLVDESFKSLNTGERVTGTISAVTPAEIQVDLGTKHTGILPYDEIVVDGNIDLEAEFHVGDPIDVVCIKFSDAEGTVLLSKKKLDEAKYQAKIAEAATTGEILHGTVKDVVKGGVIVNISGVRVFIPASQCGPEGMDLETLRNQKVPVKVFEYNDQRRRAVGSIRNAKRTERKAKLDAFYASLTEGQKIVGTVRSIMSYGAFINIGDADGMLHISEMFWGRPKNPADFFHVGDQVEVYIKSVDREKERISLGYKTEENNPWTKFLASYKVDDVVPVTIVSLMPFGAFAEIIPSVDGLIHCSQIAEKFVPNPASVLKIGDKMDVKITAIDEERQRISLSIKALLEGDSASEAEAPAASEEPAQEN